MCGIGGMLGNPDSAVLARMNHLQAHRGPDGNGIWSDDDCGLAHVRLSIVDLARSDQPMLSDASSVLVANGEIYNFRELRSGLSAYPWRTAGDSEVILALHAYSVSSHRGFGRAGGVMPDNPAEAHRDWVARLDGMFAFALWDGRKRELILARDAMGIKPLIRTMVDDSLQFASEAKALRAHEGHIPRLDESALSARLAWEYPLDGTTLFAGVSQVRPGTIETWSLSAEGRAVRTGLCFFELPTASMDSADIRVRAYNAWAESYNESLRAKSPGSGGSAASGAGGSSTIGAVGGVGSADSWNPKGGAEKLLESFVSSVSDRLMSEVPVGIALSGGLDSSLVAAVAHQAAERAGQPVPACWTVAESEDNPDWLAAEAVAQSMDLVHHQHILDESSFHGRLPDLAWHGEDLDVTVLFFQPLFEKMAGSVTVGLCGQGADELHAGYPRYRDIDEHCRMVKGRLAQIEHPSAKALLAGELPVGDAWWSSDHRPEVHTASLDEFLQFELTHGQLANFQLRLVDRHSMAHGLEVRVPFLGRAHRREAGMLPMDWRLPQGCSPGQEKAALRRAADLTGLPKEIVRRPKLPAGTATTPTLIGELLDELTPRAAEIAQRFPGFEKVLAAQPDITIGLGLFYATHILDGGRRVQGKGLVELLDEVL